MWAQKWVVGCWMWARDMLDVGCESFQKWVVGCWMWAKNLLDLDVGCESFQGDVSCMLDVRSSCIWDRVEPESRDSPACCIVIWDLVYTLFVLRRCSL